MAQSKPDETPMMRQFYSLKEKHPDAVLLFRCGDFYETYAQDAVQASEILGPAATTARTEPPLSRWPVSRIMLSMYICPN